MIYLRGNNNGSKVETGFSSEKTESVGAEKGNGTQNNFFGCPADDRENKKKKKME